MLLHARVHQVVVASVWWSNRSGEALNLATLMEPRRGIALANALFDGSHYDCLPATLANMRVWSA
jgi:hypothetical protein